MLIPEMPLILTFSHREKEPPLAWERVGVRVSELRGTIYRIQYL
jgi:hypothetical protein